MSVADSLKKRGLIAFASLLWLGVLPLYAMKVWLKTDYTDFEVYYRAAARLKAGNWDQVYYLADGASPFRYAPITLPFFRPFAELPLEYAKLAWYFLQYGWFALGFYFLYRTLKEAKITRAPAMVTAFASIFILRFCLDCFTIGQTSSLLFLCFCVSFWGYVRGRHATSATALAVPATVKIGPAFLFPLLLQGNLRQQIRSILAPIYWAIGIFVFTAWILRPWDRVVALWRAWLVTVASDSQYFDASHYGSQSIKSFLLRAVNSGFISPVTGSAIYLASAAVICGSILTFWILRSPRSPRGRGLFYCLGLFAYLWVMPETFKYSLTVLALPAALLFASALEERRHGLTILALAFGVLTLSVAGLDIVGPILFFALQKASIPLFATFFLGAACARLAWKESRPSPVTRIFREALFDPQAAPWNETVKPATKEASLLVPMPEDPFESFGADRIETHLETVRALLEKRYADSYEIIRAQGPTRSLALRQAFLESSGKRILFFQPEQPGDATFYDQALTAVDEGFDLARANRRHPDSRFRIPVRVLPLVYRRHKMGLQFNRLVRAVLPIETTDTHSGTLVMKREVATEAFSRQSARDFLFDLEVALVSRAHGYREKDLPVALFVPEEKTAHRMMVETLTILLGLRRIARQYRSGRYGADVR